MRAVNYHSGCLLHVVSTTNIVVFMLLLITFRVSSRRREMYIGHASLCVRLCVCLSVPRRMLRYCTDLHVTLGNGRCAPLLDGFAIGARVSLL